MRKSIHERADTSHAFSIAMKMYLSVLTLKGDLGIAESGYTSAGIPDSDRISCVTLLLEVTDRGTKKGWIH
jgi:hypothetical protein